MDNEAQFAMMGISYKQAPMDIRDHVVFTDTKKMDMYEELNKIGIEQAVILSTCNRSEIYYLYQVETQIEQVIGLYDRFFKYEGLRDYMFHKEKEEAIRYLYEVTNGLHSLVLGEDQILGQVVQAEEFARINGCSKKIMNHIFRDAITCAKRAKTELRISEHPLSLSYIGIKQLEIVCGLEGKEIMVLGSGKMSALAMRYLYEGNPKKIYNANRSKERAESLTNEFNQLEVVSFKERYEVIKHCDILIGATSSPHVIIRKEDMVDREKDLYIVDLASPRDIESSLREKEHIYLYDMDYLSKIAEENNQKRLEKVSELSDRIEESRKETFDWMRSSRMDTTIQTLQERINEVSEDTYTLLEHKLELSEHDKSVLKKVLKSSMKRLMRDPIISLKQVEAEKQEQYHEVVKDLFHLES
ncbi:MAG: glutamyl-tRNA reductase [Lachnospiraceae bacterium]